MACNNCTCRVVPFTSEEREYTSEDTSQGSSDDSEESYAEVNEESQYEDSETDSSESDLSSINYDDFEDEWLPISKTKEEAFTSSTAGRSLFFIERQVRLRYSSFSVKTTNNGESHAARTKAYAEVKKIIEAHYPVTLPDACTESVTAGGRLHMTGHIEWRLWTLRQWAALKLRSLNVYDYHPVVERAMALPPFQKKRFTFPSLYDHPLLVTCVSYYDGALLLNERIY